MSDRSGAEPHVRVRQLRERWSRSLSIALGALICFQVAGAQAFAELPDPEAIPLERIDEADEDRYRNRLPMFVVEEYESPWITDDRNGDGRTDYAVLLNEYFEKVAEAVDHRHDGLMDNFYFYNKGNLIRQEIDTNHDGAIDLWVYLDGAYVTRWERDTNHDGSVDQTREY